MNVRLIEQSEHSIVTFKLPGTTLNASRSVETPAFKDQLDEIDFEINHARPRDSFACVMDIGAKQKAAQQRHVMTVSIHPPATEDLCTPSVFQRTHGAPESRVRGPTPSINMTGSQNVWARNGIYHRREWDRKRVERLRRP
jgi:hypothetical protein